MRLSERLAKLEKVTAPAEGVTILRRFVAPGGLDAELVSISDELGGNWLRDPDETEATFIKRVEGESPANQHGIRLLSGRTSGGAND